MTIADVLRVLRGHWLIGIVAVAIALCFTGFRVFTTTPMYTASMVAISNSEADTTNDQSGSRMGVVTRLVTTPAVLQPVIEDLDLNTAVDNLAVQVSAVSDVNGFLTISANDADAETAADIANTVYKSLTEVIADDSFASSQTGRLTGFGLSIIEEAKPPLSPSSPNVPRLWFMGGLFGLVAAFLAIVLIEVSDKRVRESFDIQPVLHTFILGRISRSHVFGEHTPVVISDPTSLEAESIRRLALNLDFVTPDKTEMSNVIVIASAGAEEGKSTVACNIAAALAEQGRSVLLIDTDLRSPSVADQLGINGSVGLNYVLARQMPLKEAVQKYWQPNFHVLPAGDQHANPSILINSKTMHALLQAAAKQYDSVIVDTTPLNVSNDAIVFAKLGATLLVVVGQDVTYKRGIRNMAYEFDVVDITPAGVIVNFVKLVHDAKNDYYYRTNRRNHKSTTSRGRLRSAEST